MSLERIIEALTRLGLSAFDAEVYVYIANKGRQKAVNLAKTLDNNKSTIYASLRNLRKKGLVIKTGIYFSAIPFEEGLDSLIKMEKERAKALHESKKELLAIWKKEKTI